MISTIAVFFLYSFSLVMFICSCNLFMFWIFMEINLISLLVLMYMSGLGKVSDTLKEDCFYYFLIQSFGSILFLISISIKMDTELVSSYIFILSISLKVGIFPLFFWILKLSGSLSSSILILFLAFQKVSMLLVLFKFSCFGLMEVLLFSLVLGCMLIFLSKDLSYLLVSSSINSTFWVFSLAFCSSLSYFSFFLFYTLNLILLLFYSFENRSSLSTMSAFLFFCGLPPFSLFFFKFFISSILLNLSLVSFLLFWFFSFLCLVGYSKFFFLGLFNQFFCYLKQEFRLKKMYILMYSIIFSFPFVIC